MFENIKLFTKTVLIIASIGFSTQLSRAQLGGSYTYAFLKLPNSARTAALGGEMIAVFDDDINLPYHNPALLNPSMHNHVVFNYVGYFAETNFGYFNYAYDLKRFGTFAAGFHFINYGEFIEADESANITGKFYASEYAMNLTWSKTVDSSWNIGASLKPIHNQLEQYNSWGIAVDIGGSYTSDDGLFTAGLVLKNIGLQLTKYYSEAEREPLPFEIQAGISQKLQYAPFRLYATLHNLQKFDLSYTELEEDEDVFLTGESTNSRSKIEQTAENMMRHVIFGVEFLPLESFHIRLGYNYQRRQELKIEDRVAMVGFSWGFGLNMRRLKISYGRATYHLAGASNHFSVSANLSEFYHRKP